MLIHNATYIQVSTVQLNTCYFVLQYKLEQKEDIAIIISLQRQVQLQERRLKGVMYCQSKTLCKDIAAALSYAFYYANIKDKEKVEKLKRQEQEGKLIVATSTLGTSVDYLGIVYILHVRMLQSIINYVQESRQGRRAGKAVDLVMLVGHSKVEQTLAAQLDNINVLAIELFIISSSCQQLLISQYIDQIRVSCSNLERAASCNQCRDRVQLQLDKQQRHRRKQGQVEQLFNKLQARCVACCIIDKAGSKEQRQHRIMQCVAHQGVTERELDNFQIVITQVRRASRNKTVKNNYQRYQVSQKYCATGEDKKARC